MGFKKLFYRISAFITAATLLAACTMSEVRSGSGYDSGSSSSESFVKSAAMGNHFEVIAAEIALGKSNNQKIRSFARQMVDQHVKTETSLRTAVASSNVDKNYVTDDLTPRQRNIIDDLKDASGREFDQKYLSAMREEHSNAVRLLRNYRDNGKSAALRQFAIDALPHVESHEQQAYKLRI